jgi:uncharacterized membrane protein
MLNIDISTSNLMFYFKDETLISFFLLISFFASSLFIFISVLLIVIYNLFKKKYVFIISFLFSICSTIFVVFLTKLFLQRERPFLAIYQEN